MTSHHLNPNTTPLMQNREISDPNRSRIFQEIKPRCVALSKCILTPIPNLRQLTAALEELHSTLARVADSTLDHKLGEYIFFPLSHVFRQYKTLNDRSIELALLCLDILIATCWRVAIQPELAKQLLILTTFVIGGDPDGGIKDARSEETKLAGCRCLKDLFKSLARSEQDLTSDMENMPAIGHTITTLLNAIAQGEMVDLQLMAIEAVAVLVMEAIREDDMRANFYPGIISSFVKAIGLGRTTKRPHQVLREIIKFVNRLICSVLDDRIASTLPEEPEAENSTRRKIEKIQRTQAWLKLTARNTKVALDQILKLRTHPKVEVRTAVFELCRSLLESSSAVLHESITILVETTIVIAADPDENLASLAGNTLRVMASMNNHITESLRSCLDRWISALPRIMAGNDEDAKERVITRLSVAFDLCTEMGLETDLLRDMLASSISDSLIAANYSSRTAPVQIQPVASNASLELSRLAVSKTRSTERRIAAYPDVMLSQSSQANTVQSLKQLLGRLARTDSGLSLAQNHLHDASRYGIPLKERATAVWIAVNLLRGSLEVSDEMDIYMDLGLVGPNRVQQQVTEELFALCLTQLADPSSIGEDDTPDTAIMQCLALESLSLVAQKHKRQFRSELVEALYPVVHHLGHPSAQVQNHAIVTLNNITTACEYSSAQELLLDNADYMINAVSLKLNIYDISPQAPVVLSMVLKLVGPRLVPFLDDVVVSIFSILDGFYDYERLVAELFHVLSTIVEETAKTEPLLIESGEDSFSARHKSRAILTDDGLIALLRETRDRRAEAAGTTEASDEQKPGSFPRRPWREPRPDPMEEDEPEGPPPAEAETPPLPKTYEIVQRITRLSQHYLSHSSFSLRVRLLSLVSSACGSLSGHISEFLPLVNDIWPVVYVRLFDEEAAVVVAAANAVGSIAEAAGDFMSSRIVEGWPGMKRVYERWWRKWEIEKRAGRGSLGVHGTAFKVRGAVVKMLVLVVRGVTFDEAVVDDIAAVCGDILLEREDLRRALEEVRPESVWLEVESRRKDPEPWAERMPTMAGVLESVF